TDGRGGGHLAAAIVARPLVAGAVSIRPAGMALARVDLPPLARVPQGGRAMEYGLRASSVSGKHDLEIEPARFEQLKVASACVSTALRMEELHGLLLEDLLRILRKCLHLTSVYRIQKRTDYEGFPKIRAGLDDPIKRILKI